MKTARSGSAIVLLRYDDDLAAGLGPDACNVGQAVQTMLLWSDTAFGDESPIALTPKTGTCVIKPMHAALMRAAYDPRAARRPGATRPWRCGWRRG